MKPEELDDLKGEALEREILAQLRKHTNLDFSGLMIGLCDSADDVFANPNCALARRVRSSLQSMRKRGLVKYDRGYGEWRLVAYGACRTCKAPMISLPSQTFRRLVFLGCTCHDRNPEVNIPVDKPEVKP